MQIKTYKKCSHQTLEKVKEKFFRKSNEEESVWTSWMVSSEIAMAETDATAAQSLSYSSYFHAYAVTTKAAS